MEYNDSNAKTNLEAVQIGIDSFKLYSEQLTEFDKKTRAAFGRLSQTHRDQNFTVFEGYFIPFWNKVGNWKEEVDRFRKYLDEESEKIKTYVAAGQIK